MQQAKIVFMFLLTLLLYGNLFAQETDSLFVKQKDTIVIIGVGDIMLGTNFPDAGYLPPNNNASRLMSPLFDTLKNADITFGNLEGSFLDDGELVKKCKDVTKCYAFRTPTAYAAVLDSAGFDFLSVANNHAADFGKAGLDTTHNVLKRSAIETAGLKTKPTAIIERNGLKIGLCAFSPNKGTCDINDIPTATDIVKQLKAQCDIVVLSFHGGAEGADYQHMPREREVFYGENRGDVYQFAHLMIDAGADVVFGHGPHVTRAVDYYKGRFIIYSMGNFCTYARFNLKGPNGIAPIVKLWLNKEGELLKAKIIPVFQIEAEGVRYDVHRRVIDKIRELNKADLPDLEFDIDEAGVISFGPN